MSACWSRRYLWPHLRIRRLRLYNSYQQACTSVHHSELAPHLAWEFSKCYQLERMHPGPNTQGSIELSTSTQYYRLTCFATLRHCTRSKAPAYSSRSVVMFALMKRQFSGTNLKTIQYSTLQQQKKSLYFGVLLTRSTPKTFAWGNLVAISTALSKNQAIIIVIGTEDSYQLPEPQPISRIIGCSDLDNTASITSPASFG